MGELRERFEERVAEITAYLDFVDAVEDAIRSGIPRLRADGPAITAQQQRIMKASVYLQIYNLVEATVTSCLDEISKVAMRRMNPTPSDLTRELRSEWVRHVARTHVSSGPDKRLEDALKLFDHLVGSNPVSEFEIASGGGGNWDDVAIKKVAKRIGFDLRVNRAVEKEIKMRIRNDKGALALVVDLRNGLAHGRLSFANCGQDDTVADLRSLLGKVASYMREVVDAFHDFIEGHRYIAPERRAIILAAR